MKRRVVVTGLGAITPLGIGVEKNWQSLCQGKSGISMITRFDATDFGTRIAGEVKDFNPQDFMGRKLVQRTDRFIQFALAATQIALDDSGLTTNPSNTDRVGVAIGTALGGIESLGKNHRLLLEGARHQISPFFIPCFLANMASCQVAMQFGAKGPNICPVTACAAGTQAIGDAFRIIQRGEAEAMITGGTEADITPIILAGLDALRVMSTRNEKPEKASRPFDKDRDGFVISEGSGVIILEELEFALSRGAKIFAEVLGYGLNSDAYHITSPDLEGKGVSGCIRMALNDANISADNIDYINAHGTSTYLGDLSETRAIKRVFRERASNIPISANKSMIGHLWGAAGAVEAVFGILTITQGIIPPTINYETPDPECDLGYVPNVAKKAKVRVVLSNSFAFGGINAVLVFSQFPPQ
ncbi:MAG TPA: beta-ketoacyl-ACP synthase II [Dehalococcoidia bacterium]|nr:beta-ketoacyl-ACP synthase II [Dehalococcoidia bacterium]